MPDHESIVLALKKALIANEKSQAELKSLRETKTDGIAIVGLSCRFPGGANDIDGYWKLLSEGIDAIEEIPESRWDIESFYDPEPGKPGKMQNRSGGFLKDIDMFDPHFFGLSPREVLSMDPQQRILLEMSWEALEHAGIAPDDLRGSNTGVFVGVTGSDYINVLRMQDETNLDTYHLTGNSLNVLPGRLAYVFDFHGPCLAIDAACASSLVALHTACQNLRLKECDVALSAGVNLVLTPEINVAFSTNKMMLAPDGRCKTFDSSANGFVRSEGCAVVVLKRLSDARAAKDNILGIIRATHVNQSGRTSGLTVPSSAAQERLIKKVLKDADITPQEIDYIEAHGTGTTLGDPIEISALNAVFKGTHSKDNPLILGSVKTNIGHTEATAGIAGLIKVVLSLEHEMIPKHLHFKSANSEIDLSIIPALIPTKQQPWQRSERRRLAGISSFGFSGTNAHIILEEGVRDTNPHNEMDRPLHLLTFSARTQEALNALINRYLIYLATDQGATLADIAYTANTGRNHFEVRAALVAATKEECLQKMYSIKRQHNEIERQPKIAFFYTGVGSEFAGMGKELYDSHPVFRDAIHTAVEAIKIDKPLLQLLFTDNHFIHETTYAKATLFALQYALTRLFFSWGIKTRVVKGYHSADWILKSVLNEVELASAWDAYIQQSQMIESNSIAWVEDESNVVIKIGPQPLVSNGLIASREIIWLPTLARGKNSWDLILNSLAQLYQLGLTINWNEFDGSYSRTKQKLPTYPFQRQRYWPEIKTNQINQGLIKEENTDNLLYEMNWQPQSLLNTVKLPLTGTWLVFSGHHSLIEALSSFGVNCIVVKPGKAFQQLSQNEYILTPDNKEHYIQLFQHLQQIDSINGVIYTWALEAANIEWQVSLQTITAAYVYLVQALLSANLLRLPSVYLLTESAQVIDNSSHPSLSQASLLGLHRSIIIEHANVKFRLIDIDNISDWSNVIQEIQSDTAEAQVVYRNQMRYVPRLAKLTLEKPNGKMALQTNCSYLITGGLGGLGLKVAEFLINRGAQHLVLTARDITDIKLHKQVDMLKKLGATIEIVSADVTSINQMDELISKFGTEWPALKGVIHAAGVISDGVFAKLNWQDFLTVFSPKMRGTWNLHHATRNIQLDFFVTFSSAASVFGSAGQSNYAAANSFMDSLAAYRATLGLPITNIHWGPWDEVGMAMRVQMVEGFGLNKISVAAGLQALEQIILSGQNNTIVLSMEWEQFFSRLNHVQTIYENVAVNGMEQIGQSVILNKILKSDTSDAITNLIQFLKEKLKSILQWEDEEDISEYVNFLEFGMDSLMAIELRHVLQIELGHSMELSQAVIFEFPTIKQLAEYLVKELKAI